MSSPLPAIPVLDAPGPAGAALYAADPDRAARLLARARRRYSRVGLALTDARSRAWLTRSASPYAAEVDAIAARLGTPGAHLLNLSYEWACTTAVAPSPDGSGPRLMRTLDWMLDGLGEELVIGRHEGPAGPWLALGWPGFAGVVTALAPGRFAVALNQPPARRRRFGPFGVTRAGDWLLDRIAVGRNRAMPPSHLLRLVCDTARDAGEARRLLAETPVCLPVFYSLCGLDLEVSCAIERTDTAAFIHSAPICIANHWLTTGLEGWHRTDSSHARRVGLAASMATATGLDWVVPPILNDMTRLAAVLSPVTGGLIARGYEAGGPTTAETRLS